MREWIVRVMTAAALSALLELLAPDGKMRRYVSFGLASVLLLTLLSPLGGTRLDIPSLFPSLDPALPSEGEDASGTLVLSLAEDALVSHLAERFCLNESQIKASLSFGEDRESLFLRLVLPSTAPIEEISAYLTEHTKLSCEVITY